MSNQRMIIEPGNGFAQGMDGKFATRNVASIWKPIIAPRTKASVK